MCTRAYIRNGDAEEIEVETVGQLRAAGFVPLPLRAEVDGDAFCLCNVDLRATAKAAGYRARLASWREGYCYGDFILWRRGA